MATIDVVNLGGEKVGSLELADEVFGAVNEDLLWEAVKHYRAGQRAGTHATKNKKLVSGAGRNCGSRRAPAARVWVPSARRCGGMAARSTDRSPAPTTTRSRARRCWARCARRWQPSSPTASWSWSRTSSCRRRRRKSFVKTLDKLNAKGTTLLVERYIGETEKNLDLSSRNLQGVELLAGIRFIPITCCGMKARSSRGPRWRSCRIR